MRILKALLLPFLLILSLIGVDRPRTWKPPSPSVGASLLAIAVVQSTSVPDVPPSSRASSLEGGCQFRVGALAMSALWRINLWVCAFFALVTLACAVLLLHQATADVKRELQSAGSVVHYLRETAERDPASLQPRLTGSLRHVRVRWLAPGNCSRRMKTG